MIEYVDRPPRPRPALLGRHRQGHRPGLDQAALARRGARGDGRLVPRQPLVVGTPEGVAEASAADAHPHHRGRRPGRPRAGRRLRRPRRRRPSTTTRSTSPTATPCSAPSPRCGPTSIVQQRGLDRGRRLRDRPRHGRGPSTPWPCATWPTAPAGSGARVCHVSTDYVFDGTKPEPYVEWDAPEPGVDVRALEARRRARARARRHHRAHLVGVRLPRRQHGQDHPAPGRRARHAAASSTTSGATRPSPTTWPR